jgi:transcriptional regulator with XRE-family HTH domain
MALGDEKQAFSKRLREALKRAEPAAEGPAALAREFNLRYEGTPVTVQAVRKWVIGRALPSQDKIRALALWLDVSPQWLRYGDAETAPGRTLRQESAAYRADPDWVSKKYEALNDAHKKMVAELLVALLRLERKR